MHWSPGRRAYRERVEELADSAALASDPDGLRRRLAADGYLFFRGLLPAGEIRAAGLAILARLREGGWVDDRGIPSIRPRAVNSMDALADPALRAAMTSVEFNRLPYLPSLRAVVRAVLGPAAFSYPVKVLRAVYPERPQARPRGRYIHYDYGVGGVQDMLTSCHLDASRVGKLGHAANSRNGNQEGENSGIRLP